MTYYKQAASNFATWFDLCDGVMKKPDTVLPLEPCTGTPLTALNGWVYTPGSITTPATWTLPDQSGGPFNGTYYIQEADAVVGGNGNSTSTWAVTVIASAKTGGSANAATCNKLGGNVTWKLFNLTPSLPGLQLLADANLTGRANASAGSGLFLAGHKVDINTSSSTITGAIVAGNTCAAAGPNTIQGVTVNYDDTLEAPLSDIIRTTLWLDYAAG